jgi:hypothetical protein
VVLINIHQLRGEFMKHRKNLVLSVLAVALLLTVFSTGRASASTGCFNDTNGHWAETFICWMKDSGITNGVGGGNYNPEGKVTRAEMAVFMKAQAEIPPSTGDIVVSAGFANWHPFNSTDPLGYTYFSSQTQVTRSAAGSSFLSVNPDLTTVLYGKSLMLKAVEFCYDTFASTTLNYVEINTYSHTSGSLGRNLRFSDPTTRTGNECRLYTLATPVVLTKNDGANFFIQVNWSAAGANFAIGRTSFIFEPTTIPAAAPLGPDGDGAGSEVILPPSTQNTAP